MCGGSKAGKLPSCFRIHSNPGRNCSTILALYIHTQKRSKSFCISFPFFFFASSWVLALARGRLPNSPRGSRGRGFVVGDADAVISRIAGIRCGRPAEF